MNKFYIIVEITYCIFGNPKMGKLKIKHDFDIPQDNLEYLLMACVKDFYAKTNNLEIHNIEVIEVSEY